MKRIDVKEKFPPQISREERIQKITKHSIFCLLSPTSVNQLALLMEEIHVAENEVIVHEGDYFNGFFLIVSGQAALTRSLKRIQKTNPKHIVNLGPEHAIGLGEAGYFGQNGRHNTTVTSLSPMLLLYMDLFKFYHFLTKHGSIYPALKKTSENYLFQYLIHKKPQIASLLQPLTAHQEENDTGSPDALSPHTIKTESNISLREQMIFEQTNAKNNLDDMLKTGIHDLDLITNQIPPKPTLVLKKLTRKVVRYWKRKIPCESND
ncbi:cyclic nucleotide-binding domain-containing protein [uncultured Legionella sp.]|uniref:cyclic nucleotide-binding domain-containing protein n=1 Tax=uncultured Legionella sp. TaxID=210934 RepID=UPI00260AACFB|nr:cyclic nucleotide-binding domain-containing protein [uncultured Legionella sp.]